MIKIFWSVIVFAVLLPVGLSSQTIFKARRPGAMTGSQFVNHVAVMGSVSRDSVAFKEISEGNMPSWLTRPVTVTDTFADADGILHQVTFYTLPDFIAIGSDDDFFRVPLLPGTAWKIAELYGAILPTCKMSHIIHRFSEVKMEPHPMTPDSTMTTVPVFARHDSIIEAQRIEKGEAIGHLIAGHKKDIVITNRMNTESGRLYIYGWHYPDGKPIQQLTGVHYDGYVDYSHGTRLVLDTAIVDGKKCSIKELLGHPVLYALFSDEDGPFTNMGY